MQKRCKKFLSTFIITSTLISLYQFSQAGFSIFSTPVYADSNVTISVQSLNGGEITLTKKDGTYYADTSYKDFQFKVDNLQTNQTAVANKSPINLKRKLNNGENQFDIEIYNTNNVIDIMYNKGNLTPVETYSVVINYTEDKDLQAKLDSYKNKWVKEGNKWRFYNSDGVMLKDTLKWDRENNIIYTFDKDGYVYNSGWFMRNGTWYYANPDGSNANGWVKDGDSWYLLDGNRGMLTGMQLDQVSNKYYYLDEQTGIMLHDQYKNINGTSCYFGPDGALVS